jgi:hypothetical protein
MFSTSHINASFSDVSIASHANSSQSLQPQPSSIYINSARIKRKLPNHARTNIKKAKQIKNLNEPPTPEPNEHSEGSGVGGYITDSSGRDSTTTRLSSSASSVIPINTIGITAVTTNPSRIIAPPTSTKMSINDQNDDHLSFSEWLTNKRQALTRKRNILDDNEYNIILGILKKLENNELIFNEHLKWARPLINSTGLLLATKVNGQTMQDVIVKPKDPAILDTLMLQIQRNHGLPPNVYTEMLLQKYFWEVPKFSEIPIILEDQHINAGHASQKTMFAKIKHKYIYITREMCLQYTKRCVVCKRVEDIKISAKKPITPIISKDTFYHLQIDLIDYRAKPAGPDNEYKYVAHMIDHHSSMHFTEAIKEKSAHEVLHFMRKVFSIIGFPVRMQSDNGTEFVNQLVKDYLTQHKIEEVHGKPYKPTTQGKVERSNRTLKQYIKKLVAHSNYKCTWFDVLYEATLCMNTNVSFPIRKSPYEQVFCMRPWNEGTIAKYGTQLRMLEAEMKNGESDDEESAQSDVNSTISEEVAVTDPTHNHDDQAVGIRQNTRELYLKSAENMRASYNRQRKVRKFEVGDVVGIIIPKEIAKEYSNKLPVMILGVKETKDDIGYHVCYDNYRLENMYYHHELLRMKGKHHYFGQVVPDNQPAYQDMMLQRYKYEELMQIKLVAAYGNYINMITKEYEEFIQTDIVSNSEDQVLQAHKRNVPNVNNVIESNENHSVIDETFEAHIRDPKTLLVKSGRIKIAEKSCCICETQINDEQIQTTRCAQCDRRMHEKSECQYGMVQFTYGNLTYCSFACHRQQENYELKIIKESFVKNKKHYLMQYKNGATALLTAHKVETYLQYAKILSQWRKTQGKLADEDNDNDVQIVEKINEINKACCKVCSEVLTDANWHTCATCKLNIHGKIICDKGYEMVLMDDVLYCSEECANAQ